MPTPTSQSTQTPTPLPTYEPGITDIECDGTQCGCGTIEYSSCGADFTDRWKLLSGYGYFEIDIQGESFKNNGNEAWTLHACEARLYFSETEYTVRWEGELIGEGDYNITVTMPNNGIQNDIGWLKINCTAPQPHNFHWQVSGFMITAVRGYDVYVLEDTEWIPPTPAPTPVSGSYCGAIESETSESDWNNIEDIFEIPIPRLGASVCQVLMPEFTVPVTWLNLIPGVEFENDILFPGMELCVRALHFGTLKMMNLNIDLDFYAILVGAMLILRKVLRS
jgi:hypothetical protein